MNYEKLVWLYWICFFVRRMGIDWERTFVSIVFCFCPIFKYFWVTLDEMFVDTIKRCASWAFFANLFITTAATFALSYFKMSSNPLAAGTALGFGISIAIFAFSTFVLEIKERVNTKND